MPAPERRIKPADKCNDIAYLPEEGLCLRKYAIKRACFLRYFCASCCPNYEKNATPEERLVRFTDYPNRVISRRRRLHV